MLCVAALSSIAGAQRPDSSAHRHVADSIVVLSPIQIHGSIAPAAGPRVGSGIPARISIIGEHAIAASKARMLTEIVTREPGISIYDDLGSPRKQSIQMRGFSVGPTVGLPAGVAVFVDGIRQNEPDAQEVNFDVLPMDFVKRIEVLDGSASLLGPNAIAGAINLVTDHGGGPTRGEIELGGGSFGSASFDARAAGNANGWSYFAGVGADRADGWRAATGMSSWRAFTNTSRTAGAWSVNVQGYAARSRAQTAGSLPESIFDVDPRMNFTAGDADDIDLEQVTLAGTAPLPSGTYSFSIFARRSHADRFNANQAPDPDVRGLTGNVTEGANVDWQRTLAAHRVDLRAGVDAAADQVRVRILDVPRGTGINDLATDVGSPRRSAALYALADLHAGPATLSLGARYDYIHSPFLDRLEDADSATTTNFHAFSPRAGVNVALGSGVSAFASVGRSFRAPALLEQGCADPDAACPLPFALGDDPPLKPVHATTLEGGAQWLTPVAILRASAYRSDVRNEIFFIASANALLSGYFTNLDRTRRAGVEVDASGVAGRLTWYAGYARTAATFQSATTIFSLRTDDDLKESPLAGDNEVTPGDQMPLVPRDQLKLGGEFALTRSVSLGADAQRVGKQWLRGDEANQTAPLAAHTRLDAHAVYRRGDWSINAAVRNVFDTHAASFGTFNENRRSGALERFLTPLEARTVRIVVARQFEP